MLLLLLAPPGYARPAVASAAHPAALGLSLTAQPANGSAPLDVEFRATVAPTATSATFQWSFGDGASYQEVTAGYSQVAHLYPAAGTFTTTVFVTSSAGDGNASISVGVVAPALTAHLTATPTSGNGPLTVHFDLAVSGGTGTYPSIVWHFGDGANGSGTNLSYTYADAGAYNASVTVTDSSGQTAVASVRISVATGTTTTPSGGANAPPSYAVFLLPIATFLVISAALAVAYRIWLVRRTAAEAAAEPREMTAAAPSTAGAPSTPEEMAEEATSRTVGEDPLRLSERILVHLYWYGRPTNDGVARPDSSQAGMARRLGVAQNSLSKSLRRLIDAGAVRAELRHVPGAARRLKTYSLTARGEAVARTIRANDPRR